jgi:ribulose-bisphosphate carboxylase large chain
MRLAEKAEKETGERKGGLFNVTAPGKEMYKRASLVADYGNPYVMIDILTAGWSAAQGLREQCNDLKLAIYAHRAFHSAFTRNPRHGVSMLTIAKTSRLIGVDNVHVGTGIGKLAGSTLEVKTLANAMRASNFKAVRQQRLLDQNWGKIKNVIPVSSGGLHPGNIPEIFSFFGADVAIQVGGGTHGHPNGSHAGAKAVRQAISATLSGVDLRDYSRTHPELRIALDTWGFKHIK